MKNPAATYHFGKFTLQTGDHRLSSDGREIYLRPKTYDTLLYLLEHHGHLVTKHELLDSVWADVEVGENTLTHCVKEARAALDDDVQHPRFLRTIPRLGYEFVAEVETSSEPANEEIVEEELHAVRLVTTEEQTEEELAPVAVTAVSTQPLAIGRRVVSVRSVAVAAALLVGLSVVAYRFSAATPKSSARQVMVDALSWFGATPAPALTPRDYVLIGDFENQTGDPIFDRSLVTALATSLDQSSAVNVYSPVRVKETLRRMLKTNVERIDEALAMEIAEREGIKVVVLPTISGVGHSYRLSARIRAVSSSRDVKTEVAAAASKERVLDAVDELAAALRRDLGESLEKISASKPLTAATTPSLEALKLYSLGLEKHRAADAQEAKTYYENALAIDPDFTTARASLGMLHIDQAAMGIAHFDAEEGKRLMTEAVQNISNLTDKEKYTILAYYAESVEHDWEKAVRYHKALLAIYPENPEVYDSLAWVYHRMGRYEEAIAAAKQAIRIDPHLLIAYANLAGIQLYQMGDVKAGLETCQQALRVDPQNAWCYDCVGWAMFGKGDWAQAQAAFEKAVLFNPQSTLSRYRLAHAYRLQGHYQQALQALQPILTIDPSDATPLYDMGVVYEAMGDESNAREHFQLYRQRMEAEWRKNPKDVDAEWSMAEVLLRLGEKKSALFWTRKGLALDPNRHFEYATVLSLNGQKQQALEQLRIAIQKGYPYPIFIKIHPDLQALHGPEFEQLLGSVIKN